MAAQLLSELSRSRSGSRRGSRGTGGGNSGRNTAADCLFLFAFQILGLNVRNTSAGNPYAGCDPAAAVYTFTIPLDACTYTNAFLADVKTDAGGNFHAFSET